MTKALLFLLFIRQEETGVKVQFERGGWDRMEDYQGKRYVTAAEVGPYLGLSEGDICQMQKIVDVYPMAVPSYYLSLINPEDPEDPIRKMCIPTLKESDWDGELDTSGEADNTVEVGLQHKYRQTALILSTNHCAMYCRHCFRKRLVGMSDEEIAKNFDSAVAYISAHREISNVLITGGDSLMLSDQMLEKYLEAFSSMEHLDLIRFGTRIPVVWPQRILEDGRLQDAFRKYAGRKQIYIVTQFNHPRELTREARAAIRLFVGMGIVVKNQTVLLKGVNDSPQVLGQLLKALTAAGAVPYYVFQCRPVRGVKNQFQVPLEEGARILDEAKNMQNGQGKCIRYCMSLPQGKVEILGKLPGGEMLFKFHQAKNPEDAARLFSMKLEEGQGWLEL